MTGLDTLPGFDETGLDTLPGFEGHSNHYTLEGKITRYLIKVSVNDFKNVLFRR